MKSKLSNADILFIRACKSNSDNPRIRINKIYRRFYCIPKDKEPEAIHLALIFLDICEMTKPMELKKLLSEMNPYNNMFYKVNPEDLIVDNESYWNRVLKATINNIRFTSANELGESYRKGARWRKRDEA